MSIYNISTLFNFLKKLHTYSHTWWPPFPGAASSTSSFLTAHRSPLSTTAASAPTRLPGKHQRALLPGKHLSSLVPPRLDNQGGWSGCTVYKTPGCYKSTDKWRLESAPYACDRLALWKFKLKKYGSYTGIFLCCFYPYLSRCTF
jgi:hypothetical protein